MIKYILLFLLIPSLCYAADPPINEKYSYKDFTHQSFKDRPASEFNNTTIAGSCFYQEWRKEDLNVVKDIFPDGITGVKFVRCNLDNVFIPIGNTVDSRSCKRIIKRQNDGEDWILDIDLKPKEPMNKEQRLLMGVSIDPENIPNKEFTKDEKEAFDETLNEDNLITAP